MAINFPDSPATNDSFTAGGKKWIFDGTIWGLITANSYTISEGDITAANLATGAANNYVLTADSSLTSGVKWAVIPPSGGLSTTTEGAIMTMTIGA
jgi:hypothetical protein